MVNKILSRSMFFIASVFLLVFSEIVYLYKEPVASMSHMPIEAAEAFLMHSIAIEEPADAMNFTPDGVLIDVEPISQHPKYPTGCESVSLYMLLDYYGVDVTVDKIVQALPKGKIPYKKNGIWYGSNPEKEFIGNPTDANSYGVFNAPIAMVAQQFKPDAKYKNNATLDDLITLLRDGNPVIAWCSITPNRELIYYKKWLDEETQQRIEWPTGEHAVLVCGYNENEIIYNDPNTGTVFFSLKNDFLKGFNELGGRIVYYEE